MSDSSTDEDDSSEAARMEMTADTLHEEGEELSVDCPSCGTTVPITQIVYEGRCGGTLEGENNEAESWDQELEGGCGAKLSMELVWWE